jgi:hypothetical protein
VEFLSGLFFPPFFGYFKSAALFFGTLGIANSYINVISQGSEELSKDSRAAEKNKRILQERKKSSIV